MVFSHCSGDVQPADMLTKPLSSARIRSLSSLIGLVSDDELDLQGEPREEQSPSSSSGSQQHPSPLPKVLVALLLLSQATTGESVRDDAVMVHGSGVSVDYGLVTSVILWLLVLGCLVFWEGIKWLIWVIYDRASPGARSRRLRRLQKLRDATTEAIQREIAQRNGSPPVQRALDAGLQYSEQQGDPPRARRDAQGGQGVRSEASKEAYREEQLQLLRRLAKGVKETSDQSTQTSAFSPVQAPGTRVILRYVHEPPEATFYVPENDCYHVYGDCYAFRHRGTKAKVERRRICQYCLNRASEDPDKSADYGRDLERAREYEQLYNTTLTSSGQSTRVSQT